MKKQIYTGLMSAATVVFLAGCGDEENEEQNNEAEEAPVDGTENNNDEDALVAHMENTDGETLGNVVFEEDEDDRTHVKAEIEDMEEGFHGFHLHEEAVCDLDEEEPFESAGGHYNPDEEEHPEHAGDLPPLYANEDGTASMSVSVDHFEPEQLIEEETAVIIHEDPDNLGHIPERYESEESGDAGPDEETLDTGDAGDRFACGVVEEEEE